MHFCKSKIARVNAAHQMPWELDENISIVRLALFKVGNKTSNGLDIKSIRKGSWQFSSTGARCCKTLYVRNPFRTVVIYSVCYCHPIPRPIFASKYEAYPSGALTHSKGSHLALPTNRLRFMTPYISTFSKALVFSSFFVPRLAKFWFFFIGQRG